MISREDIDTIRAANGAESTLGSPSTDDSSGEAPYGYTLVGAISKLDEVGGHMDEYGLAYADLSSEKQAEFDEAHEALQWHVAELGNVLADGFVGTDDEIELPNGNSVALPKTASSASSSKDLPARPS